MASSSSSFSDSSSTGGVRRLTVSIATQDKFVVNRDTGYRVTVTATAADEMSADVFRYLYQPPAGGNEPAVRYDGVCSPADMAEMPAGDPLPNAFPAWCRRNSVDLVLRSSSEADDMIATIKEELQTLVDSLNRMDQLLVTDVATFQ